jgi:hypothetical protein
VAGVLYQSAETFFHLLRTGFLPGTAAMIDTVMEPEHRQVGVRRTTLTPALARGLKFRAIGEWPVHVADFRAHFTIGTERDANQGNKLQVVSLSTRGVRKAGERC